MNPSIIGWFAYRVEHAIYEAIPDLVELHERFVREHGKVHMIHVSSEVSEELVVVFSTAELSKEEALAFFEECIAEDDEDLDEDIEM